MAKGVGLTVKSGQIGRGFSECLVRIPVDGPVMSICVVPCVWLWGIRGAENIILFILLILSKALRGQGIPL